MEVGPEFSMVQTCYQRAFGARLEPFFAHYQSRLHNGTYAAALGFRRASEGRLFLESYLDESVEDAVSAAFACEATRDRIVEIGNFGAVNAMAMIELWTATANDLGAQDEYAVATLTAPLRAMFSRLGVSVTVLADARPERLGSASIAWGNYYHRQPQVCVGRIADGQAALSRFAARRFRNVVV